MKEVHRIRLRGPWEVDGTVHIRKFGRPRSADPNERIWLIVESTPVAGVIRLNDGELGRFEPGMGAAHDVTELLLPRNRLEIQVSVVEALGEVCLEIR